MRTQHALEQSDYHQLPPAPQEQSFALTRRRHSKGRPNLHFTAPFRRSESSRFCPRVFANFRHFSQKSALKRAKIRAPDWTYAGPGELRMQARGTHMRNIHALERSDYLQASPRSAGKELRSHQLCCPPFSDRFCPRVFPLFGHFSQESVLQTAEIRALLWAYRGPRERKDAGKSTYAHTTCPGACDNLSRPPLRRNRALLSRVADIAYPQPPIGKNLSDSVREFSVILGTFPRKVH